MKKLLLCSILLVPAAHAEELQFDFSGGAGTLDGVSAGAFDVSFTLDTLSGAPAFTYYSPGCLELFSASGATAHNVSMSLGGQSVLTGASAVAQFGGANAGTDAGLCPGSFVTYISFTSGSIGFGFTNDPAPGHGGTDPAADILLGETPGGGSGYILLTSGIYYLGVTHLSVTPVPEPATLGLWLVGLAGMWLAKWRKRK